MKRVSCTAPNIDDLLIHAATFDEGRISLDSYEIYQLLATLAAAGKARLGAGSVLRLGSASLRKDSVGNVTVSLKHKGLCFLSSSASLDSSLAS